MDEPLDVRLQPSRLVARPATTQRRRRFGTPIAAVALLCAFGIAAWLLLKPGTPAPPAVEAPQAVAVATIGVGHLNVMLTGLGAVTPLATVTVRTQINGQLQEVAFTEGQLVHKGDVLVQIDPRPYQAALDRDLGLLARDTALLAQARADNARYQTLNRQDSISRQTFENQAYVIRQDEGTVQSDQGVVDIDRLNVAYCRIVAPIEGRVGIRMVDPGNYVQTTDTTGLVVLTQVRPISVVFSLPEDMIGQIRRQAVAAPLVVQAYDRSNTALIATGTLASMDSQIDSTTGTVKLRALFPNADEALFPQAFVNARLLVRTLHGAVVAPQAAIQSGAPGTFVYLLKPDGTVRVQPVTTGVVDNTQVEVTKGLAPGDRVATDGVDRLRDGAKVVAVAR